MRSWFRKVFKVIIYNAKMEDEEIIQLHESLSNKYVSKCEKNLKAGVILGGCAVALGLSAIIYRISASPENVNQYINRALGIGFYAGTCGFFGGIFNGLRNARRLMKVPKEVSDLVLREK